MIEEINFNELRLAIIIRNEYSNNGIKFFGDINDSQQIGFMTRPKGYIIQPHRHNLIKREINQTQEVLFLKSGLVKVNFYDNNQNYISSIDLKKGDVILLIEGGHGFEFKEKSELIEVKQGPYIEDEDKIRF